MAPDPLTNARAILHTLQTTVDRRDLDALVSLFDDPAVLIGTAGDGRNRDTLRQYLAAVATQPASLRWEWRDVITFHEDAGALGFAAFGEIIVSVGNDERRAPIRLTIFAVQTQHGWRLRQFHGSIPTDF